MKTSNTKNLILALTVMLSIIKFDLQAQPCAITVPSYTVNLTGFPAGVWTSSNVSRNDQCCGVLPPNQCIYFYLTLDPNAAGIQIDMIGADPPGSLFYDINCTGNYPGGTIKCITGVGPHPITFCKPGSNKNIYKITSISKPLFPKNDTTRLGCTHKFTTLGIVNNSVTWNSIFPGAPGQYNSYLDSVNVASPTYSPAAGAPFYVDYQVCGFPVASGCGYSITVCDTVRIYNFPKLNSIVSPNPATYCNVGPGSGVNLTGSATGGSPTYSYTWKNTSSITVGTGSNYFANAGLYYLEVKDILFNPLQCPAAYTAVSVSQGTVPVVDAGLSQKKCASNPMAILNGTVQFAAGGIWTGGAGTYSPGNTFLNTNYTPSAGELAAGFAKLYLTSTGAGGGCVNKTDSIKIYYSSTPTVTIPSATIACFNGTTVLNSLISGGTAPHSRLWNTGSLSPTITAGQGNYSIIVFDSLGCTGTANYNLVSPTALALSFNITNVTVNGGNDGTASVTVSGGTPAYSVTWTPGGANTFSINNLVYGIYTASVTDANGCNIVSSAVVNEPRCLGFVGITSSTNVSCYGAMNGVATVTALGGTPGYTYTWNTNPVQTGTIATNLNAGVRTVVIADNNNCFQTANVTITEPTQLTNVMTQTNVSIIGGNDGAAAANPFGGTIPYTYLWSNGPTTSSITNLTTGTYSVAITDNKGCVRNDNVFITQPPCNGLTLNLYKNNVSCFGGSNGSALAVVTGAVGTYTINWSNGGTGASVSNLVAGNYSVIVTDGNNCNQYINFTITQPSQLTFGLLPTNVSCNGFNNGTIDLTLSGGTYPYSFNWSNGSTAEDLVGLTPGNYSVQINDINGCSIVGYASITQPLAMNVTYTSQNVTCIYGNNGAIGLNITGGTFPFTYTWSTGAFTQSVSGLTAGGYSVIIKDANNCTLVQPLIIPVTQPDSVKVGSFSVACSVPGSNSTQVTVIPQGGNPGPYQVSFNNGFTYQTTGAYSAMLTNGSTYTVLVRDVTNCVALLPSTITILGEVKIDSVVFAKCYPAGTVNTLVTVYPSGGDNGPYQVSFNNGVSYLAPGIYTANLNIGSSYTILAMDTRSCVSAAQTIMLPTIFGATTSVTSNYNGQNISCFGLTNGSVNVTASGGSGAYTYTWSSVPPQNNANANNLGAGTYSVLVKDGNNCTITRTVTLTQPAVLTSTALATSNFNGQNVSCFGFSNGTASVTAGGGTIPYNYSWSSVPIQTAATATNLSAGIYTIIVSDINGCSVTKTVNLTQPNAITSTVSVTSNYNGQQISCFGGSNGTATITASNGTSPYTYTWSTLPVQTGTIANSLSAGTYSIIVTDINGCNITKTVSLSQPAAVTSTVTITSNFNGQNISCFGLSDGSASVSPAGGTAPYTYSWSTIPTQTNAAAINLSAQTYTVNVTDINGCSMINTITLSQPPLLTSTLTNTSNYNGYNISCFGLTNGSALVTASGGFGAYTYTWSTVPPQNTSPATNLGAGTYTAIVKDGNNCTVSGTVILTEPPALTSTALATSNYNGQNVSCFGFADGTASVTAGGGTTPYSYNWSTVPVQTAASATNLSAGVYTIIVNDINNCSVTTTVNLTQPAAITSTLSVTSNYNGQQISCFGNSDGTATVSASNGTSPYTYTWSTNPVQTGTIANSLSAGNYSVIITDVNGCNITNTITLTQPVALTSTIAITSNFNGQDISCFGLSDGSASVTANGGTTPYTYTWSTVPSQTTAAVINLSAQTYSVNITDLNGCAIVNTVTLSQPPAVNASLVALSNYNGFNVSCFGSTNGNADITVVGGTGAFTYTWSNAANTQDIMNVGAGNYSVVASDANGCTDTVFVVLTQPDKIIIKIDSLSNYNGYNISCAGEHDGVIYTSATGGVGPYTYLWSDYGSNSPTLTGVGQGSYTLTIVDLNNCLVQKDTVLTEPPAISFNSTFTQPLCNGVPNGSINITTGGGVNPFTYSWSNGSVTEDLNNISAGVYTVICTDKNNCVRTEVITVTQPQAIALIKNITSLKCYADTIGKIALTPSGGTLPYTYQWLNGASTSSIGNLKSGTYIVKITDFNGCIYNDTTKLTQPDSLQVSLFSPLQFDNHHVSFVGGNDGSINLTVSGGVSPYNYLWSNTETSKDLFNIVAGTYFVTVVDYNGCKASAEIKLTEPLVLEMPSGYSPNNDGKNDFFVVHGIEAYPQNKITIYNRWGNIVYTKTGYANEWNGNSKNGGELPDATYFVILEINGGEKILKGFVELRR